MSVLLLNRLSHARNHRHPWTGIAPEELSADRSSRTQVKLPPMMIGLRPPLGISQQPRIEFTRDSESNLLLEVQDHKERA